MNIASRLLQFLPPEQISTEQAVLEQHGYTAAYHDVQLPDVVVYAKNREEVRQVLMFANEEGIPVIPFGAGTSVEGQITPIHGGICLDLSLMNKIVEVRPQDFIVRVQPGVRKTQLNAELKKYGLFFAVDPGSDASIGGMAATNASGTTTVRYGGMREQVRSIEVVLPSGAIIQTGTLAAKSSAGYNFNGIFIGSEGTLGVFTELTLTVRGLPEAAMAVRASFPSVENAVAGATAIIQAGIPVARMELVDEVAIRAVNRYKNTDYPEVPTLFLEFQGNLQGLQQDAEFARKVFAQQNYLSFDFEHDEEAREQLWDARRDAALAFSAFFPGTRFLSTDVCVPISELPGAVKYARQVLDSYEMPGAILGHVGDGNYHVLLPVKPGDEKDQKIAREINAKLVEYALARGGTCSGEHGVGIGKREYIVKERGPEIIELMRGFKKVCDPKGILNPGKIF